MKKKKHTGKRPFWTLPLLALTVLFLLLQPDEPRYQSESTRNTADGLPSDTLQVHVLDVGNGLSVLVTAGEEALLYDGGGRDTSSFVVAYLKEQGIRELNYCIASHYDADHLYGIVGALNAFETDILLAPNYNSDTKTYQSFLRMVQEKNLTVTAPAPGQTFPLGDAVVEVLAPLGTDYEDDNDYSIVIKISMGERSLLLTGDATSVSEKELLEADTDLSADVLVIGHHGCYSSTGNDFFSAVSPSFAVISCGLENDYGHPHKRVMQLLEASAVPIYRTDLQGTIRFSMTGTVLSFEQTPCEDYSCGNETIKLP